MGMGWNEPAATNAPVEDEPVQPVLRMNILPARGVFFSSLLCPTYLPPPIPPPTSPLLPTTYEPHPPSLHRQSSSCGAEARAVELLLWSCGVVLELWSCCCGVGAGARAPTRPTRPRSGKMLTFFLCFFCLKRHRCATLQRCNFFFFFFFFRKEGDNSNAAVAFFFAAEEKKEGDGSAVAFYFLCRAAAQL